MHVLFIYPDICIASGRFHEGIGYLSSVLKTEGHKTSLLHIEKELTKEELCARVDALHPDLIGFSATTNQYPYVQLYSRWIKETHDIPLVCGGIHPTLCPEEVISDNSIDILCMGEGEYPLLELANKLEKGEDVFDIRNLWVKQGKVYRNPLRPLIENLDELPFPDRELFDYGSMLKEFSHRSEGLNVAEVMTGRGCPFNCTYCCNHALRKFYQGLGNYTRRRSVDNVLAEIEQLIERYKVNWLIFDDDTFTLQPKWIEEFCEKYRQRFSVPFQCNAFPTTLNGEIIQKLKQAGCERIAIGIESGNEWLRKEVLKRPISNEQIVKAFRSVAEAGIKTYSFNMVGFPHETPEMIEDTIKLNLLLDPDHIQTSIFYPYPGTQLYELCKENDWLGQDRKSSYFAEGTILNLPTLTQEQITDYYRQLHALSIDKIVQSGYPRVYPCYRLMKGILGESLTYRVALRARKLLYHY